LCEAVAELGARFPDAPREELERFCKARPGSVAEAGQMYEAYQEWRKESGSPERLLAAAKAVPQEFIRHCGEASDGSQLVLVQGARYDASVDTEQYVLAIANLFEELLPPTDNRKATCLLDVRPAEGWPNVPAPKMLPLMKRCMEVLPGNYPERLQRVVIYPMPWIVKGFWTVVRAMLDPAMSDKFVVLSGACAIGADCPPELGQYVSLKQLPDDAQHMHAALAEEQEQRVEH